MQIKESTNFLLIGFYILTVIFRTRNLCKCPKSVISTQRAQKPYYRRTLVKTNLSVSCKKKKKTHQRNKLFQQICDKIKRADEADCANVLH